MAFQINSLTITTILLLAPFFLGISSALKPPNALKPPKPQLDTTAALTAAFLASDCSKAASPDCCYVSKAWFIMAKDILGSYFPKEMIIESALSGRKACCPQKMTEGQNRIVGGKPVVAVGGFVGVTCDSTGRVSVIQWATLPYNPLSGPIPPYLGNLTKLEAL
jgi:hypothetical protein